MTEQIAVSSLGVDPVNPRTDPGDIADLAASIADLGLQRPLQVRPLPDGTYGVYAGQRRLGAVSALGWVTVACEVRELDDLSAAVAAAADQLASRELNPIDEARTYRRLLDTTGLPQAAIAAKLGVSPPTVVQRLKLLELPDDLQEAVADGEMTVGAAYRMVKKTRGALAKARARPRPAATIDTDNVDVLDVVTVDALLTKQAEQVARRRNEQLADLVARAVRRELARPSCVECTDDAMGGADGGRWCLTHFQKRATPPRTPGVARTPATRPTVVPAPDPAPRAVKPTLPRTADGRR